MVRKMKKRALMFLGIAFFGIISLVQNLPFMKKDTLNESDMASLFTETAYADVVAPYDNTPPCPPGPCE